MATNIAKLSVQVVANASTVKGTLDSTSGQFDKFAKKTGKGGGLFGGLMSGGLSAAAGGATVALQGVGLAIGALGAISSTVVGAMIASWVAYNGEIGDAVDNATRLGMEVSDLMALEGVFGESGLSNEEMIKSMLKSRGKVEGDMMDVLRQTADAVSKMDSVQEKAKAIETTFGVRAAQAAKMVTLFAGGTEELDKQLTAYKAIYSLTEEQASAVESAGDSWARMGYIVKGIGVQMAAATAPAVAAISGFVNQYGAQIANFTRVFTGGLAHSVQIIVGMFDILIKYIGEAWEIFSKGAGGAFDVSGVTDWKSVVLDAIDALAIGFAQFIDWSRGMIAELYKFIGNASKTMASFTKDSSPETTSMLAGLMGRLLPGGEMLVLGEKAGTKMVESFGDGLLAVAEEMAGEGTAFTNDVTGLLKRLRAPVEVKAKTKEIKQPEYAPVAAMLKGSTAAYSIEARFRAQGDIGKTQLDVSKEQLQSSKKQVEKLTDIERLLLRQADDVEFI